MKRQQGQINNGVVASTGCVWHHGIDGIVCAPQQHVCRSVLVLCPCARLSVKGTTASAHVPASPHETCLSFLWLSPRTSIMERTPGLQDKQKEASNLDFVSETEGRKQTQKIWKGTPCMPRAIVWNMCSRMMVNAQQMLQFFCCSAHCTIASGGHRVKPKN